MKESPTLLQQSRQPRRPIFCPCYNDEEISYPVATSPSRLVRTSRRSRYNDEGISYPAAIALTARVLLQRHNSEDISYPVATILPPSITPSSDRYNDEDISYPVANSGTMRLHTIGAQCYNDEDISYPVANAVGRVLRSLGRCQVRLQW